MKREEAQRMREFIIQQWSAHKTSCALCDGIVIYLQGEDPCPEARRLETLLRKWSTIEQE